MNSIIEEVFEKSLSKAAPSWLREHKAGSLEACKDLGIPNRKDEQWKYTSARKFDAQGYSWNPKQKEPDLLSTSCVEVKAEDINIVFVNGIVNDALSSLGKLPKGLEIKSLEDSLNDKDVRDLVLRSKDFNNGFEAQNDALLSHGLVIKVARNAVISENIHLVFANQKNKTDSVFSCPKVLLICGESSEVNLRESHIGEDSFDHITSISMLVDIRQNAKAGIYKFQKLGDQSKHLDHTKVYQARDSRLETFSFFLDGSLARNDLQIMLQAPGAEAIFNGVYKPGSGQHIDNQTTVDHQSPHCQSSQLYKGVLLDGSRAVFNGKVLIRKDAQQTDAQQLNNNLLLSKNVEIDTKPQMEIDADDVKCAHGATVGQMDEDELFYLQSRGIRPEQAKTMLATGYLNEAIQQISNESVKKDFESILKREFLNGAS